MSVTVRPLHESDLAEADRIFRLAFGTFIGLPNPMDFAGDSDWVASRWRADPDAAFAAEVDGRFAGSNLVTNWGGIGFFGPLTVHPDFWNQGVAHRLLEPTVACFERWHTRHAGLFTFAQSARHVWLYQRFGFYPRFLIAVMERTPPATTPAAACTRLSASTTSEREALLAECRVLTNDVFEGLDVTQEIRSVATQRLGETLLVRDGSRLDGVAVCHVGAGSEGGSGVCYVKFAASRGGSGAGDRFERLLDAIESYAASRGARVSAGVNLGREDAYRRLIARGYRTAIQAVSMHRPNVAATDRPDVYVLDDWR
jgi:GNAT superfamily N-acetyltransferase